MMRITPAATKMNVQTKSLSCRSTTCNNCKFPQKHLQCRSPLELTVDGLVGLLLLRLKVFPE